MAVQAVDVYGSNCENRNIATVIQSIIPKTIARVRLNSGDAKAADVEIWSLRRITGILPVCWPI